MGLVGRFSPATINGSGVRMAILFLLGVLGECMACKGRVSEVQKCDLAVRTSNSL